MGGARIRDEGGRKTELVSHLFVQLVSSLSLRFVSIPGEARRAGCVGEEREQQEEQQREVKV